MKAKMYRIQCVTNLHMGSGDINFNIVDNEVQRDPVNNYPVMFSSGIKGAMREHFERTGCKAVTDIFGSDVKEAKNGSKPGSVKFLTGTLLALPVRASRGEKAYYLVATKGMIAQILEMKSTILGQASNVLSQILDNTNYAAEKEIGLDGISVECKTIPDDVERVIDEFLDTQGAMENFVIVTEEIMRQIHLPVLARNYLEDGISKNLWYEEVVPHEAVFVSFVLSDGTPEGDRAFETFDQHLMANSIVQFGADASIGYGITKVQSVSR